MSTPNKKLVLVFLFLTSFSLWSRPHDKKILSFIEEQMSKGDIPGYGALIMKGNKIIHVSAHGKRSISHENKVDLLDRWHLGSNTKAMTAFLIALAVQEQKLSYEDSAVQLLKVKNYYAGNEKVTIKDLISHQSYLRDVQEVKKGELWKKAFVSREPLESLREEMSLASLNEKPRKANDGLLDYSNMNYVILGSILENVYKMSWENLMQKKLFSPLGMNSCGFGVAGKVNESEPSEPWPHTLAEKKMVSFSPEKKADNPLMIGPAGSVHCNLFDWAKFVDEVMNSNEGKGSLLKDKKVSYVYMSPAKSGFNYTFGGWGYKKSETKKTVYQHSGSNTLNYATVLFSPESKLKVFLAMNIAQPKAEGQFREVLKKIVDLHFDE